MATVVVYGRKDRKHVLCLRADDELARLCERVDAIRLLFNGPAGAWRAFVAAPDIATFRSPGSERTIQARFRVLQETVISVRCYIGHWIAMDALDDIPILGEQGDAWLEGFLDTYRTLQRKMEDFTQEFILTCMVFVALVRIDAAKHRLFFKHYGDSLSEALMRLWLELMVDDNAWERTWCPKLLRLMDEYPVRTPHKEKILIGLASLDERGVVQMCSRLFKNVLDVWDATHGLVLPLTRRIFEVFAYEMEPAFQKNRYQLTHLFDR